MSAAPPREVRARARRGSNSDGQLFGHVPRSVIASTAYAEHAAKGAKAVRTAGVLFIGIPPSTETSERMGRASAGAGGPHDPPRGPNLPLAASDTYSAGKAVTPTLRSIPRAAMPAAAPGSALPIRVRDRAAP